MQTSANAVMCVCVSARGSYNQMAYLDEKEQCNCFQDACILGGKKKGGP